MRWCLIALFAGVFVCMSWITVVASLDPTVDLEPEFVEKLKKLVSLGEFDRAGDLISDELLDRFSFSGSPDDIIRQTCELFEAGVDRVEFGTPHGLDPISGIKLLGDVVLTELKAID